MEKLYYFAFRSGIVMRTAISPEKISKMIQAKHHIGKIKIPNAEVYAGGNWMQSKDFEFSRDAVDQSWSQEKS